MSALWPRLRCCAIATQESPRYERLTRERHDGESAIRARLPRGILLVVEREPRTRDRCRCVFPLRGLGLPKKKSDTSAKPWRAGGTRIPPSIRPSSSRFVRRLQAQDAAERLERDDFSSNRHPAPAYCWSMIFSEHRYPLFGIMLWQDGRVSRFPAPGRLARRRPPVIIFSDRVRRAAAAQKQPTRPRHRRFGETEAAPIPRRNFGSCRTHTTFAKSGQLHNTISKIR